MSDESLIEQFADALWMERGLSRNTLAAYQSDLAKADEWLDEKTGRSLRNAHREDLLSYLAELGIQGRSARSTARLLSSLRQFYQWLVRENMRSEDPSAQIEMPKQGRPLPKSLTEDEVERLLDAPDLSSPEGFRDRTMFELLYATGLRVSELVTLRPDQVSLNQGVVRVTGKGGKERLVPLGEEAADWLQRFVRGA
ncbi:MAG: site-specific integrase, partial [Chromatiales bacterium]